jgi:chromosome segregation ATPase
MSVRDEREERGGYNGDFPEGLDAREYARIAAKAVVTMEYSMGKLLAEVSATAGKVDALDARFSAFQTETHQNFEQLGVMRKRIRTVEKKAVQIEKKAGEIEKKATEIEEELEDTAARDLRAYKRKYNQLKAGALSAAIAIVVGVAAILIAHYAFHVG